MIAPSICKSEAVSRNIRAICLLSIARNYIPLSVFHVKAALGRPLAFLFSVVPTGAARFFLPRRCFGASGREVEGPRQPTSHSTSSLRLLLSDRCYLLSPRSLPTVNLFAHKKKNSGNSR